MRLQIELLGQFRVSVDDRVVPSEAWRRERGAALVKLLAISPGHRLHREQAMDLFWPDLDPEAAGANLRKAVHFARRSLGVHELLELSAGPKASTIALYERALAAPAIATVSAVDRIRASLAWGLVHLHSGDFAMAERIATETRGLAHGAELAREMGEASALLGLVAHMQGRWRDLFHVEFTEWVRAAPTFVSKIFDGHLCLAEFCLYGANGHESARHRRNDLAHAAPRAPTSRLVGADRPPRRNKR